MIELGATINDVVLAFLQAEIETERGPQMSDAIKARGYDRSVLIDKPDLGDAHANTVRAGILGDYRGFGRNEALFRGFPSDTSWRRVLLDVNDIDQLKYVGTKEFFILSNGTQLVGEGGRNYKANPATAKKVDIIREKISRNVWFPELVLVQDGQGQFVIIEGNHRATAYAIERANDIRALVGTSVTMDRWNFIELRYCLCDVPIF
jgi:hypothetical protein